MDSAVELFPCLNVLRVVSETPLESMQSSEKETAENSTLEKAIPKTLSCTYLKVE